MAAEWPSTCPHSDSDFGLSLTGDSTRVKEEHPRIARPIEGPNFRHIKPARGTKALAAWMQSLFGKAGATATNKAHW